MEATTKQQATIVHLDVDAFYVACERELNKELRNRPLAVSQYNPYGDLKTCLIDDPARILYDGQQKQAKKNPNANGSLIAVSYEARASNVKRNDRGLEAVKKCPELVIVQVPVENGKASLTLYRDASERLMAALTEYMKTSALDIFQEVICGRTERKGNDKPQQSNKSLVDIKVEKASVDEIYIDLSIPVQLILKQCREANKWESLRRALLKDDSASSHTTVGGLETSEAAIATNSLTKDEIRRGSSLQVDDSKDAASAEDELGAVWWGRAFPEAWGDDELSLAIGALITVEARKAIVNNFDGVYTLSAGISSNKIMAKLASGLKKPNRQTLINPNNQTTLQKLFHPLPIGRIRGLGGKLGEQVAETLSVKTVGELAKVPLSTLQQKLGDKQARFLFRTAQGICDEAVTERTKPKCIGAGKTFRGVLSMRTSEHEKLKKWLGNLVNEVHERMSSDKSRFAKTLVCWLHLSPVGGSEKSDRKQMSTSAQLPRNASAEKSTDIAFKLAKDIIKSAGSTRGRDAANPEGGFLVIGMAVTATNFVPIAQGQSSIVDAFKRSAELSPTTGDKTPASQRPRGKTQSSSKLKSRAAKSIAAFLQQDTQFTRDADVHGSTALSHSGQTGGELCIKESRAALAEGGGKDASMVSQMDVSSGVTPIKKKFEAGDGKHTESGVEVEASVVACKSQSALEDSQTEGLPAGSAEESVDPDLEYAKQLQASYDRENDEISRMEQRRSSLSRTHHEATGRKAKRRRTSNPGVVRPISNFFAKLS